jgi:SecD/SecF fusion protein
MFKQFFWKILLCVLPVLLSLLVIWDAWARDGFKLGVDLVGGTILVYEIDTRKQLAEGKESSFDPKRDTNLLAESLKRRIDPNDLYNIVIRPAGGEGRVEIILPTGGVDRNAKAEQEWQNLLEKLKVDYHLAVKPEIPRGRVQELTDYVLQKVQEKVWEEKLYNTPSARKELIARALEAKANAKESELRPLFDIWIQERNYLVDTVGAIGVGLSKDQFNLDLFPVIGTFKRERNPNTGEMDLIRRQPITWRIFNHGVTYKEAPYVGYFGTWLDLPIETSWSPFDYKNHTLRQLVADVKSRVDDYAKEKEIDAWFKQQAWHKMIGLLLQQWPSLSDRRAAFEKLAPDAIDELVGRVECKGDTVGQAFLTVIEPMTVEPRSGQDMLKDRYVDSDSDLAKDATAFISARKVRDFIREYYGPSPADIERDIEAVNKDTGYSRDLTVEEVQRIKDLVTKLGSLEFRILANSYDDKEAIDEARNMLNNADNDPNLKTELDDDQNSGLPPPPPRKPGTKEPKQYTLTKLRGGNSAVTYSWVELGPQERQQLGLNNTAVQDGRGQAWSYLNARRRKAERIPLFGGQEEGKYMLQGALFYSRECQDRNMPEEERRRKKYEYFVLTRNPEIDPQTGKETPKIDGSFLTNAANQPDNMGRPAVSFTFNAAGGRLFREVTRKNIPTGEEGSTQVKRHLAIILDGLIASAPTINSEISTHGQISGSFTNKEVDQLVNVLRAGQLPATLKQQPVSESTMGATLGRDTIQKGLAAIVVAFGVVLLFMIVYYRFAGLVASIALLANLVLTVGFMVAVKATFTLPGLAGLVLMLGMAVDANILIYERLREERDKGASILLALRNGYDRAFWVIIDTHLTSIFTGIVLYIVGNDQLKGFGVSLVVGLLISLFTSLFMTRLLFDLWAAKGWLTKLSMFRFFSKPDIDFMTIRYYLFAATGILTILGGALFIGRLPDDLNIDFVGGTAYSGQLEGGQAKDISQLRTLVGDENQNDRLRGGVSLAESRKTGKGLPKVEEVSEQGLVYKIEYDDGSGKWSKPYEVRLANKPEGATPEQRATNVARRASDLPDWTVEQIFLGSAHEADSSKSRFFTVRSTEKEPEIVQTELDRLLQEKDQSGAYKELLKKVEMQYDPLKNGRETHVRFFEQGPSGKYDQPTSASPSFVTTLLTHKLNLAFGSTDWRKLFSFELAPEGPTQDGRVAVAKLLFTPKGASLPADDVANIEKALAETKVAFNQRPAPERLETFDSQLAAETRLRAMYAVLLSWGAILLYLWFRFGSWTFGLAAVICLIHDLFFTLGVIAICHYVAPILPAFLKVEDFKIDLPAVAALLTLVGYSVNDTIVVFDRIREVRGKNPDLTPQMINDSVNQTLSRTLLSSLTTWLVVIVLYFAGGPGVHLFAFVMVVGVVVGTYSSIYVASPLLLLFGEGVKARARTGGPTPVSAAPDTRIQPA